jgi:hypothetical protein
MYTMIFPLLCATRESELLIHKRLCVCGENTHGSRMKKQKQLSFITA